MNLLLLNVDINISPEITKCFIDFMSQMMIKMQKKDEEIYEVKAFIKNEVLLYLIDKWIEANM